MRKTHYAAIASAFLILTGLSVYPRLQPEYALAQSARAMSRIESAHVVGWSLDRSGNKKKFEIWVKGNKTRWSYQDMIDTAFDGKVGTTLIPGDQAIIQPSDGVTRDLTLALFGGQGAIHLILQETNAEVAGSKRTLLPDGASAIVTEVRGRDTRWLIYTDPRTDLVIRHEQYRNGSLYAASETFEYNIPISDSVFRIAIPKGIPVIDLTKAVSAEKKEWRQKQHQKLSIEGAEVVTSIPSGKDTSRFHPEYSFECIASGGLLVYYVPDDDMYWVLGTARVTGPHGFSQVVKDGTIQLPGEAKIYEILMDEGDPGAFCDADKTMIVGYECVRFVNAGSGPLTIKWDKARRLFVIKGKARLLPQGDTYTDQTVSFYSDQLPRIEKPVWTGLPDSEAAIAQEEFDILKRSASLVKHEDRTGDNYINGGKVELDGNSLSGMRLGQYKSGYGLSIEQVTKAQPHIYIVPSQRKYYVVGTAMVKVKGEPDRVVKNAVVDFDGVVLSSEK